MEPLTHAETLALTDAILQAAEAGDHQAAADLAALAKDPDAVRKILEADK